MLISNEGFENLGKLYSTLSAVLPHIKWEFEVKIPLNRHVIKHSIGGPLPEFIISVNNIHRSETAWENPDQFNPDR